MERVQHLPVTPTVLASLRETARLYTTHYSTMIEGNRASKAALNMFLRTVAIEYRRTSPHTIVVMLHPGTTDTRLSQPFQKNVPTGKLFSVEQTVNQLLEEIKNLDEGDSGHFFSWDGSCLPW